MKKKYFLRGLGAGIMMSAIILGITSPGKELSNEEIKKRAMKLGMNKGPPLGLRISVQKLIGVGQIWDIKSFQLSG